MRKHPVDNLFKDKLHDWERQPSAEAWSRIAKEKKDTNRKIIGWLWYVAAGISVTLITGYLVWQWQEESYQSQAKEIAVTSVEKVQTRPVIASADSLKPDDLGIVRKSKTEIAAVNVNRKVIPLERKRTQPVQIAKVGSERADVQVKNKTNDQVTDQVASLLIEPGQKILENPVIEPITKKEAELKPLLTDAEENKKNRIVVVNVEESDSQVNEKQKASRLTKVFRQLKNARAGEPVDWKDVGFNPKTIVAKVDEKIRDKEEIILEKYQDIKERTKL